MQNWIKYKISDYLTFLCAMLCVMRKECGRGIFAYDSCGKDKKFCKDSLSLNHHEKSVKASSKVQQTYRSCFTLMMIYMFSLKKYRKKNWEQLVNLIKYDFAWRYWTENSTFVGHKKYCFIGASWKDSPEWELSQETETRQWSSKKFMMFPKKREIVKFFHCSNLRLWRFLKVKSLMVKEKNRWWKNR